MPCYTTRKQQWMPCYTKNKAIILNPKKNIYIYMFSKSEPFKLKHQIYNYLKNTLFQNNESQKT